MAIEKPYHRNWRPMKKGPNSGYSGWAYIIDKEYAQAPTHYIRAFELIQSDFKKIIEYVEPSKESLKTYSYRIHELLMRTCIEVEANFKAILLENGYVPATNQKTGHQHMNMGVYHKLEKTHHLSSYEILLPTWNGAEKTWKPFSNWKENNKNPDWYDAYNQSKHHRQESFSKANLEALINALSGLLVVLSSQFGTQDFSPAKGGIAISGRDYEYYDLDAAIGGYFRIGFPNDWREDEQYDFDWSELRKTNSRFQKINYNAS